MGNTHKVCIDWVVLAHGGAWLIKLKRYGIIPKRMDKQSVDEDNKESLTYHWKLCIISNACKGRYDYIYLDMSIFIDKNQ